MDIEVISTGDELIDGFIADTNAAWLGQELLGMGLRARRRHTVGDSLGDIAGLLLERAPHCDVIIVNGGLGPTTDDVTAAAAAAAAGVGMARCEEWVPRMRAWWAGRRRGPMPESNLKQAMIPEGATLIDNPCGSACGFWLDIGRAHCCFTPGVPSEFRAMFSNSIRPALQGAGRELAQGRLFLTAISESALQGIISAQRFPASIAFGYRAAFPVIELKLRAPATRQGDLNEALGTARRLLGDFIIAEGELDLGSRIRTGLAGRQLALLDPVTRGALAAALGQGEPLALALGGSLAKAALLAANPALLPQETLLLELEGNGACLGLALGTCGGKALAKASYPLEPREPAQGARLCALIAQAFLARALNGEAPPRLNGGTTSQCPSQGGSGHGA
ncbi:MAG: hypothetical protein K6A65_00575 [Succinivibrionaceae bacterium]|nr:hypothetical protein [Succinivibrionaceae bacterium]